MTRIIQHAAASDVEFSGIGLKVTGLQKVAAYGVPTDSDLALINKFTLKPLKSSDVSSYTLQVCNDQIDRDDERFSLEVLHDFADTLPGKGLLEAHQWGPVGVGLFFRAWVENINGVNWVMGQCYLPKAADDSAEMITKIDSGIAKWVSIGFYAPKRVPVMKADTSGGPVSTTPIPSSGPYPMGGMSADIDCECMEYQRGDDGERGESLECSLVFLGAQYDAAVVKSMTNRLEEAVLKDGRVLSTRNLDRLKAARDAVHDVITMHETHHGDGSKPPMEEKTVTRIVDSITAKLSSMFGRKYNENHESAGSSEGGQFASGDEGGGGGGGSSSGGDSPRVTNIDSPNARHPDHGKFDGEYSGPDKSHGGNPDDMARGEWTSPKGDTVRLSESIDAVTVSFKPKDEPVQRETFDIAPYPHRTEEADKARSEAMRDAHTMLRTVFGISNLKGMFTGYTKYGSSRIATTPELPANEKETHAMELKDIKKEVDSQVKSAFSEMGFDVDDIKGTVASIKSVVAEVTSLKKVLTQVSEALTAQTEAADTLAGRMGLIEISMNDSETKDKDGTVVKVAGLKTSMTALAECNVLTAKMLDEVDNHLTDIYATLGVAVGAGDEPGTEGEGTGEGTKVADVQKKSTYKDKGARDGTGGKTTADIFGDSLTPMELRKSA